MSMSDGRDLELDADDLLNLYRIVAATKGQEVTGTFEYQRPSKHDGPRVRCLIHQGIAVFTNDQPTFPEYAPPTT